MEFAVVALFVIAIIVGALKQYALDQSQPKGRGSRIVPLRGHLNCTCPPDETGMWDGDAGSVL